MTKIKTGSELELKEAQLVYLSDGESIQAGLLTRWLLLMEALFIIDNESEERGTVIDEEVFTKKAKQHKAITKYINERYFGALSDVIFENNL